MEVADAVEEEDEEGFQDVGDEEAIPYELGGQVGDDPEGGDHGE